MKVIEGIGCLLWMLNCLHWILNKIVYSIRMRGWVTTLYILWMLCWVIPVVVALGVWEPVLALYGLGSMGIATLLWLLYLQVFR
jgi:hypothetical protein